MSVREIDIDELEVGMYVTKLDVSWLNSPFLMHQIRIKSPEDIAKLRAAKVKRVVIDTTRTTVRLTEADLPTMPVEPEPVTAPPIVERPSTAAEHTATTPLSNGGFTETSATNATLGKELADAQRLATRAKQTLQRVMDDALAGNSIDRQSITPIIDDTFASLGRNDQALLTLMHLERHGGARQVTHAFSVLSLALTLGHQMQLSRDELEALGLAALLHDVGWVRLPASLFGKSRPYTDKELKLVNQHVSLGLSILAKSPELPTAVGTLISMHHERAHDTAEPDKPSSHLETAGYILAAVDAYDSMLHGLDDHPPMLPNAALRNLFVKARSGQFDPTVMSQLVHTVGIYPVTSIVVLNTGEIGIVVELKRPHSLQPVVKICYSADRKPVQPPRIVDLSEHDEQQPTRRIEQVLHADLDELDPYHLLKIDLPAS